MTDNQPNKPRRTGDEIAAALVDTYSCGSCQSDPPQLREASPGIFVLKIGHDPSCPVLTGAISSAPDMLRAVDRAS